MKKRAISGRISRLLLGVLLTTVLIGPLAYSQQSASTAGGGGPTIVRKSLDETVTSSTTFQDDDHLQLVVANGETWVVEIWAMFTSTSATPDAQVAVGQSGGTALSGDHLIEGAYISSGGTYTPTSFRDSQSGDTYSFGILGIDAFGFSVAHFRIMLESSAAQTLTVRWAQGTSDATATKCLEGSYIIAHKK